MNDAMQARIDQQRAINASRNYKATHRCRICGRTSRNALSYRLEGIGAISIVVCKDPADCERGQA